MIIDPIPLFIANERRKMKEDKMDVFDNKHFEISPDNVGEDGVLKDFHSVVTPEIEAEIKKLYDTNPQIRASKFDKLSRREIDAKNGYTTGVSEYYPDIPWIQTHSGKRFTPTNPIPDAIIIQDIAHALSMQCRFAGHVNEFYSVAQHSVGVSHLCDEQYALWGLLHDATEAYLVDVPSPLKRSEHFDSYRALETKMQSAICTRFGLEDKEPPTVKKADQLMLVTEARDLMSPLRSDWGKFDCEPLPFTITPMSPKDAKNLFLKRFFQLIGMPKLSDIYCTL